MNMSAFDSVLNIIISKFGQKETAKRQDELHALFFAAEDLNSIHALLDKLKVASSLDSFLLSCEKDGGQKEQAQKIGSSLFTCPKCRLSNCEYTQLQTRSSDEGMTNFCHCLECNNDWRE